MTASSDLFTVCVNHPQVPTALRCNKCGKPVCMRCIVRTPVGYRCKECVRGQQQVFETAGWPDYVLAAMIVVPLSVLASLACVLGFFVIFIAPVAGGVIAELVRAGVRQRRGPTLNLVAAAAFVLGGAPALVLPLLTLTWALFSGAPANLLGGLLALLWPLVYIVAGAGALYARLRGIALN